MPNARLLALLDKMVNPIGEVQIQCEVKGLYAIPDDWKIAEGVNPAELTFKVSFQGGDVDGGKQWDKKF